MVAITDPNTFRGLLSAQPTASPAPFMPDLGLGQLAAFLASRSQRPPSIQYTNLGSAAAGPSPRAVAPAATTAGTAPIVTGAGNLPVAEEAGLLSTFQDILGLADVAEGLGIDLGLGALGEELGLTGAGAGAKAFLNEQLGAADQFLTENIFDPTGEAISGGLDAIFGGGDILAQAPLTDAALAQLPSALEGVPTDALTPPSGAPTDALAPDFVGNLAANAVGGFLGGQVADLTGVGGESSTANTIGSTVGSILGSAIPIPGVGSFIGSILGQGIIGSTFGPDPSIGPTVEANFQLQDGRLTTNQVATDNDGDLTAGQAYADTVTSATNSLLSSLGADLTNVPLTQIGVTPSRGGAFVRVGDDLRYFEDDINAAAGEAVRQTFAGGNLQGLPAEQKQTIKDIARYSLDGNDFFENIEQYFFNAGDIDTNVLKQRHEAATEARAAQARATREAAGPGGGDFPADIRFARTDAGEAAAKALALDQYGLPADLSDSVFNKLFITSQTEGGVSYDLNPRFRRDIEDEGEIVSTEVDPHQLYAAFPGAFPQYEDIFRARYE